ncbi:MAG: DUF2339 domain-containing protein [Candidatus Omnitrophica bacterium]|nr:DUF2339 domain-containing protein [Candidatus Omnitrophota bacterium]
MKYCIKCKKQFDDTWQVCINCNERLVIAELENFPLKLQEEFKALTVLAESINKRIKVLEKDLITAAGYLKPVSNVNVLKSAGQAEIAAPVKKELPEKQSDEKDYSLESKIGRVWFNRIGIMAVTLGMAFFLKYAFDNNWIGELGRVVLGLLAGFAMIICGELTHRKKYKVFSEGFITGGASILYLSIYAAVNFYKLIGAMPGFGFMAMVTLFAAVFAVRFDSPRVIIFSIIGGFLTPFLITIEGAGIVPLFAYILLLDMGILCVSYFKKWEHCNLIALLLTYFTYTSWHSMGQYKGEYFFIVECFITGYFLLFSLVAVLYNFARNQKATSGDAAVIIFNGIFYFLANYALLTQRKIFLGHIGFFAIALAAAYLVFAYSSFVRTNPKDRKLIFSYLSLTLLFATVSLPLELRHHWLVAGFIIESTILVWLGFKIQSKAIRYTGLGLAVIALLRLMSIYFPYCIDSQGAHSFLGIFNRRFLTYFVLTTGIFASSYLYKSNKSLLDNNEKWMATLLSLCAVFVLFVNLTIEIAYYFAHLAHMENIPDAGAYPLKRMGRDMLRNMEQFSISAMWAVYSLGLIIIGIVKKFRALRIMALILLAATIFKVFLFDISGLAKIWRILSFMGLGCVLIGVSFIYQKYKDKISGLIGKN